jgi:hypothetical protein
MVNEEDIFSAEVEEFLSLKINESEFRNKIEVLEKQQILMNLTVGRDPKTRTWRYYMGMQQQDIVLYLRDESDSIQMMPLPVLYHWASTAQRRERSIRIPLLVCELKVNQNLTTHHFVTYSRIAEQIRDVHPYCAYYFIVGGPGKRNIMSETTLRQGKGFTRMFLNWEAEKSTIWNNIEIHLSYIKDSLDLFKKE